MKKIYLLLLLVFPIYCHAHDNPEGLFLSSGVYEVIAMPLVDEQKNIENTGYVNITQFPALLRENQIPSVIWVISPKNEKGNIDPTGEYLFILLNPNLCKPFDNGMPSYPVFEFTVYRGFRSKSENSGCILNGSNQLFNSDLKLEKLDKLYGHNRFAITTSSPILVKEEVQSLVGDKRCAVFGKCEINELKLRTYTQPTLKYLQIAGVIDSDAFLMLPHSVSLYANVGDQIPFAILPPKAPFLIDSTIKKSVGNETWIRAIIPPNMIKPSPYSRVTKHPFFHFRVGEYEVMYVKDEDLTKGAWFPQNAQHTEFDFKVSCSGESGNSVTDGIAIYKKGHKEIYQLITGHDGDSNKTCEDQIEILDANFDGHLDISLPTQNGGAGPNSSEYFFLFDAKTKRFNFNQALSDLFIAQFDPKNKEVTSSWRGSCCDHGSETYRFIKGKMVLVKTWRDFWTIEDNGKEKNIIETGRLINGKMRIKKVVEILKTTESQQ